MASQTSNIRIVIDAMGGDYAPAYVVEGAMDALRESRGRFSLLLVGQTERLQPEIDRCLATPSKHTVPVGSFSIVNANEVIEMHDSPNTALRSKKDSSITVGVGLHRDGNADAFVSAGNTGAVLSASTLLLGRIEGVGRPTIGAFLPTTKSRTLLVDAGTNVDCKARHLFEFGIMGSIYVSAILGKPNPTVGLLNVGEEDSKGNEVCQEAFGLMKKSPLNFVGNIEGRDILAGKVDVVVCDGFVGNILLKFGESVPSFFKEKFRGFAAQSILNKLVVVVARKGMRSVMKELDYQESGGVPLLGVKGVSIIGHGGSTPKAIKNMIYRAEEMVIKNVNAKIAEAMHQYKLA